MRALLVLLVSYGCNDRILNVTLEDDVVFVAGVSAAGHVTGTAVLRADDDRI